jgi:DNA invertase Pin-like site-specific DNA recombinase
VNAFSIADLDRLARRSDDLERVIEIYDAGRAAGRDMVFSSAHDAINLSSPDGITLARVMIAFANKASRDTARRVAAQRRSIALTGAPVGGTRPFGWDWHRDVTVQPDGSVKDGKRTHVLNEVEAAEIRRVADELLNGARINHLVDDLNARGVMTPRGNQWKAQTLKQMLLSPRLAGLRVHQGQVLIDPNTKEWVRGQWEPILDDHTWMAVADRLSDVAGERERRAEPQRKYLIGGVLRCSECNGPLHGNARADGHWYYQCKIRSGANGKPGCGKISASGQASDRLVERLMRERMRTTQVEYTAKAAWEKEGELTEIKTKIRQLLQTFSNSSGEAAEQALAEVDRLNDDAEKLRIERSE